MMQYAIRVIRDKSSVRRQDIPTGKQNAQRKIQPEEDVLYLVYDKFPPCCFRNVYWLQFTDEIQVQQKREWDYFTLGSLGFTHFQNSAITEFFDIADWVDEKRAFDHMTMMKDQRQLISKILRHASNKINEMDRALPGLYKLFLKDLLKEVDGRIEKVTKIPTSFEDATVWLTQISEMMPSHAFRQLFDAKCANLSKLQDILKDRGASWLESEAHERVRKLELDWESTFDTLIVCLDRVQDRDSEHRRSFRDLTTRTDEYIDAELRIIRRDFENIPMTLEERSYDGKSRSKMKKQEKDTNALKNDISSDRLKEKLAQRLTYRSYPVNSYSSRL
uniref:Dynein heavy chain linker domain-containing protein n=1 Tax=Globisporangium ultimum (strain ATCC 200006 / CBS 805.95 / DAOM BR144) TaxID=431595 RepID=K3WX15_GLOUD